MSRRRTKRSANKNPEPQQPGPFPKHLARPPRNRRNLQQPAGRFDRSQQRISRTACEDRLLEELR